MKFAYQRQGGPLVTWGQAAPKQSRAAETSGLGSLGGTTLDEPTLVLPAPGAPEPIGVTPPSSYTRPVGPLNGCSCHGSCGCGGSLSGFVDSVPGGYITLGVAAFLAWRMLRKHR
jgi:hypothetical protein